MLATKVSLKSKVIPYNPNHQCLNFKSVILFLTTSETKEILSILFNIFMLIKINLSYTWPLCLKQKNPHSVTFFHSCNPLFSFDSPSVLMFKFSCITDGPKLN